jgi:hypothetical protein
LLEKTVKAIQEKAVEQAKQTLEKPRDVLGIANIYIRFMHFD